MSSNIFVVWNMHIDCQKSFFSRNTIKRQEVLLIHSLDFHIYFFKVFCIFLFELILHSNISPSFCIFCSRTFHYFHVCPPFSGCCADFLFICGFDKLYAVSKDLYYLSLNFENCFEFNLSTLLLHLPFIEWCRFL